jgi:hypothetical protein
MPCERAEAENVAIVSAEGEERWVVPARLQRHNRALLPNQGVG